MKNLVEEHFLKLIQIDLFCYGPVCTAASCAGLFLVYFDLAFIYDRVVFHSKFVRKDYVSD